MDDNDKTDRANKARQSGADGDHALGQDARSFGVGGQTIERPPRSDKDDSPERDVERDESLPENAHPSRSER